ncbi:MAG TPA: phosphoenolpyruvate carboxykinase [Gaiellales bacterium]|jgi:phosphoenolpyruvate carboxykinase (ATP)|nr:phosphoenolpyruvate carboxykinase [Gaiellales bacterium]
MAFALPEARSVLRNPSQDELHRLATEMPNARVTSYGAVNVQTRVLARSKGSTFIVAEDPESYPHQARDQDEWERVSALQDEYIAGVDMIQVDGFLGDDPEHRVPARLLIEKANANIAGMQDVLYFHDSEAAVEPELVVIYTPNLAAPGYPDERLIAVNLDLHVTRVLNSDYFGESKKGGLRMWNKLVYDRGGLALHAGCKVIPTASGDRVGLIVGLSGTGKTTTTFTRQNGSLPVQDDFVAWWPDGSVSATEAGCFAKTFALNPGDEPTIHGAVTRPSAYLENVSQSDDGVVDFYDQEYTRNGRAVFSFADIEAADASVLERADFLLVLNRNQNIIPAVAKLEGPQAAAFFMLGETTGTAAGGKDEEGKFLRVPGTNPFFPLSHDLQGNRFLELLARNPIDVYLLNTGSVGGADGDSRARNVAIPHSSAIVKGIAESSIEWQDDPDFGYKVAARVPGIDVEDADILQPRRLYEAQGRAEEYAERVARLKAERAEYLSRYPSLSAEIIESVR